MKRAKHVTLELIQATSEKVNKKRLTDKQAIFIQEKLKGKSGTQAALQAYNTTTQTAEQIAHDNIRKPQIVNVFQAIMDKTGLTDEYLTEKVMEGIDKADIEGKKIDYLEMALKLKGHLKNVSVNLSHSIKESRKGYDLE